MLHLHLFKFSFITVVKISADLILFFTHSHSEPFPWRETVSAAIVSHLRQKFTNILLIPSSYHNDYSDSLIGTVRNNSHVDIWEFKIDFSHSESVIGGLKRHTD